MENNSDSSLYLDKNGIQGHEEEEEFEENLPDMKQSKDIFKLYKYKLDKLQQDSFISGYIMKFWELLDKDFKGEIDKNEFLKLFTKIYKLLLPSYNHREIDGFLEGEWQMHRKQYHII